MGYRGGLTYTKKLKVGNTMADPQPQHTLQFSLLQGIATAQQWSVQGSPEVRNFTRANRLGNKAVVSGK